MFSQELVNAWKTSQPADPNQFESLPNGRYIVRIDAVKLDDARVISGKELPASLTYEMTVTEGEFSQSRCRKTDFINGEKSFSYIKLDMNTLRCRIPAMPDDMALSLQSAVGMTIEIEIKRTTSSSGKEFINTYIKRVVDVMPAPAQAQAQQPQQNPQYQPAPQAQIDGYHQMMAQRPMNSAPAQQYPQQRQPQNFGPYGPNEEIPF